MLPIKYPKQKSYLNFYTGLEKRAEGTATAHEKSPKAVRRSVGSQQFAETNESPH